MPSNTYSRKRLEACLLLFSALPGGHSSATAVGQSRRFLKDLLDSQAPEFAIPVEQVHFLREVLSEVL